MADRVLRCSCCETGANPPNWMERQSPSPGSSFRSEVVLGTPESTGRTTSGSPEVTKAHHGSRTPFHVASKIDHLLQAVASLSVHFENTQRDVTNLAKRVQELEIARKYDFLTDIVKGQSDGSSVTGLVSATSDQAVAADLRIGSSHGSLRMLGGPSLALKLPGDIDRGTSLAFEFTADMESGTTKLAKSLSSECISKSPKQSGRQRLSKTIFRNLNDNTDNAEPPEETNSWLSARSDGPVQFRPITRSPSVESKRPSHQRLPQHAFRMLRGDEIAHEASMPLSARSGSSMGKGSAMRSPSVRSSSPRYRGP